MKVIKIKVITIKGSNKKLIMMKPIKIKLIMIIKSNIYRIKIQVIKRNCDQVRCFQNEIDQNKSSKRQNTQNERIKIKIK